MAMDDILEKYPSLMQVGEVAAVLRVSKRVIYQYIENGAIASFRPPGPDGKMMRRILVPKSSLLNYLGIGVEQSKKQKGIFSRRRA
jgi:excisionase family DNA binding protein